MSKFVSLMALCLSMPFTTGCASLNKPTVIGAGIGSLIGGSIGLMATDRDPHQRPQGIIIGASLGGLLGGLIGHDSAKPNKDQRAFEKINSGSTQVEVFGNSGTLGKKPTLKPAQIKIKHVDDQIKDGVFIPAHLEYQISEPARWEDDK